MNSKMLTLKEKKSLKKKSERVMEWFTLSPYSLWAALFIIVPLVFVAYYALTDSNYNFTFENITRFFTATSETESGIVHTYLVIFMRSLKLAIISTIVCLLLGYPIAYIIARAPGRTQRILITLIMIPMCAHGLV